MHLTSALSAFSKIWVNRSALDLVFPIPTTMSFENQRFFYYSTVNILSLYPQHDDYFPSPFSTLLLRTSFRPSDSKRKFEALLIEAPISVISAHRKRLNSFIMCFESIFNFAFSFRSSLYGAIQNVFEDSKR